LGVLVNSLISIFWSATSVKLDTLYMHPDDLVSHPFFVVGADESQ